MCMNSYEKLFCTFGYNFAEWFAVTERNYTHRCETFFQQTRDSETSVWLNVKLRVSENATYAGRFYCFCLFCFSIRSVLVVGCCALVSVSAKLRQTKDFQTATAL